MKIVKRFMNIIFYIITSFCVIFTFQYLFGEEGILHKKSIVGLSIFAIYIYSYYSHQKHKENILKTYYVEKENYDVILKELLKHLNNKN